MDARGKDASENKADTVEDAAAAVAEGTGGVRSKRPGVLSGFFKIREIGVLIALLLLFLTFSLSSPFFFGLENLLNILRQV
jgi:predicted ABC-type sugar transport system permease subunit